MIACTALVTLTVGLVTQAPAEDQELMVELAGDWIR